MALINEEKRNERLFSMLFEQDRAMKLFRRDTYADCFHAYFDQYQPLFKQLQEEYAQAEEPQRYLETLAVIFTEEAKSRHDALPKRGQRDGFVIDHNQIMVIYVIPSLNECKEEFAQPFIEILLKKWNETFTRYAIKAGTFETINAGFKRKLCYVTTAVCRSLGKAEGCYELQLLKDYRDRYLSAQPDGAHLIHEYYDIAPTIVNRIDKTADAQKTYEEIYHTYLQPCIHLIENGRNEACKDLYINMIRRLQNKYMYRMEEHA